MLQKVDSSAGDSVLLCGDSALRDKAGSLWLASSIDNQVLSPCSPLHNPAFSSQLLESQNGFAKQAQPLESTFEKTAELQKVDSSDTAPCFVIASLAPQGVKTSEAVRA
ncbi:hypothetical protein [Helicobacter zhangjianzhongii]|uniref:Uncharacterized protein n=1 Tax=Helicobacter zhangjianzhongii TaxID=2974574 RepID=A0ACC6FRN8_9HELI|nr:MULTISPECIES: hypothetical protein [unclassified Helicobacter]MDL0080031.1 hypothetical protein [Helicobacter sp. CPD2-1]MDL0081820.1 hypothetical protein [Helicobacter sp. XJK30-2]